MDWVEKAVLNLSGRVILWLKSTYLSVNEKQTFPTNHSAPYHTLLETPALRYRLGGLISTYLRHHPIPAHHLTLSSDRCFRYDSDFWKDKARDVVISYGKY